MKLSKVTIPILLVAVTASSYAHKDNSGLPPPNPWRMTAYQPDGHQTAFGSYASKEGCEKDIPNKEREQHVSRAECVPEKL